jgi:hypothetical protein
MTAGTWSESFDAPDFNNTGEKSKELVTRQLLAGGKELAVKH